MLYKISNHLTGVLFYGATHDEFIASQLEFLTAWQFSQGERPSTGWKPEFRLGDEIFCVLTDTSEALYVQNVNSGIKFWLGGSTTARTCLELIPVKS